LLGLGLFALVVLFAETGAGILDIGHSIPFLKKNVG
jgi:hypothetical protein